MSSTSVVTEAIVTSALTTSEVVVASLTYPGDTSDQSASVMVAFTNTQAATAGNLTLRLRQGSLTGPIVDATGAIPQTASVANAVSALLDDTAPPLGSSVTYVVTAQLSAGTGTASALSGELTLNAVN